MAQIFTVTAEQKAFRAVASVTLRKAGSLEQTEMEAVVNVPLGVSKDKSTVKKLLPVFQKVLNDIAEKRSGRFLKQLEDESRTLSKMIETNTKLQQAILDGKKNFVTEKNDEIQTLWANWSTKLAPRYAAEALETCLKKARDADSRALASATAKATGKVSMMPKLTIAAGFFSGIAAAATAGPIGIAGAFTGMAKILSGYLKHTEETAAALQSVQRDQAALVKDVDAVYAAVVQVHKRLGELNSRGGVLERQIISITQENAKIRDAIAKLRKQSGGEAGKEIARLTAALDENAKRLSAVDTQIFDTAAITSTVDALRGPLKQLVKQSRAGYESSGRSEKDLKKAVDVVRESVTVATSIAKLS